MSLCKRALRLLTTTILVVVILLVAAVSYGVVSGRYRTLTVLSGSMRPTMPEGAVLVQVPITFDQIQVGDVITYRIPQDDHHVVSHRVVAIDRTGGQPIVTTRGDANPTNDPWKARLQGNLTWKTIGAVPRAGFVLEALRGPTARKVCFLLIPVVLAALWLRDIWRPSRPRADRSDPSGAAPATTGA